MRYTKRFKLTEVIETTGLNQTQILECIEEEWIVPASLTDENSPVKISHLLKDLAPEKLELDQEDIARLNLIRDLKAEFDLNNDAIPLVLHLVDQLNCLRQKITDSVDSDD